MVCGGWLERLTPMNVYFKAFLKGDNVATGANSSLSRPRRPMYITLVCLAKET